MTRTALLEPVLFTLRQIDLAIRERLAVKKEVAPLYELHELARQKRVNKDIRLLVDAHIKQYEAFYTDNPALLELARQVHSFQICWGRSPLSAVESARLNASAFFYGVPKKPTHHEESFQYDILFHKIDRAIFEHELAYKNSKKCRHLDKFTSLRVLRAHFSHYATDYVPGRWERGFGEYAVNRYQQDEEFKKAYDEQKRSRAFEVTTFGKSNTEKLWKEAAVLFGITLTTASIPRYAF
ncbi:MAG TPA: hypothetical protein VI844_02740 [Coxiellaceae bacterium]|nr:hypothetical protein [Coxiellaceae bacterium]